VVVSNIFGIFTPNVGEDSHSDQQIFQMDGSTTIQIYFRICIPSPSEVPCDERRSVGETRVSAKPGEMGLKLRLERQDQPGHGGDSGLRIPSKCQ